MNHCPLQLLLTLSLLYSLANGIKPVHADDTVYYAFAAHIAKHPLDPYGFELAPGSPANHVLAPPVLLYWLAAGLRLLGENPVLLKLWLVPFGVLFVFSLYFLFQRFAGGLEMPLTWMTVLSPVFLPGWNLMLDVPALALSLFGLVLFFRACDEGSWRLALGAGITVALAMQTKYTAFVAPAVMLGYAVLLRRFSLGLLASALAVVFFVAWECWLASRYGESHFMCNLRQRQGAFWPRIAHLILPLITLLGGMGAAVALLGLTAAGAPRKLVLTAWLFLFLGYGALACIPQELGAGASADPLGVIQLSYAKVFYGTLGIGVCTTVGAVIWQSCRGTLQEKAVSDGWSVERGGMYTPSALRHTLRLECFLALWLALEVGGYFVLSPFPAARRVMGIVVLGTILAGRLAAQTCLPASRKMLVQASVAASILLGIGYYAVDLYEARAAQQAVEVAAQHIRAQEPCATIWYFGDCGFQFYANQGGMKPVVSDRSQLHQGDWLVVSDTRIQPWSQSEGDNLELVTGVTLDDWLPLRTMLCYYCGRSPLTHRDGPRYSFTIYRFR